MSRCRRSTLCSMKLPDIALAALATARLTRFVTTDKLGDWWIVEPAKVWAIEKEGTDLYYEGGAPALDESKGWRSKLATGLECPFCVGFWIGGAVAGSYLVARQNPTTLAAWRVGAGILGLNYVVGHVSSRLD